MPALARILPPHRCEAEWACPDFEARPGGALPGVTPLCTRHQPGSNRRLLEHGQRAIRKTLQAQVNDVRTAPSGLRDSMLYFLPCMSFLISQQNISFAPTQTTLLLPCIWYARSPSRDDILLMYSTFFCLPLPANLQTAPPLFVNVKRD